MSFFSLAPLALLLPAVALGASTTVRLEYTRGDGAEACPDAPALAAAVEARIGRAVFAPNAVAVIQVSVWRQDGELLARIQQQDSTGRIFGERSLQSKAADCLELEGGLRLLLAMAAEPFVGLPPRLVLKPSAVSPSPPEVDPFAASLAAGASLTGGLGPVPSALVFVEGRLGSKRWSLGIDVRFAVPSGSTTPQATLRSWFLGGGLTPCFHLSAFAICAVASAGAQTFSIDGEQAGSSGSALPVTAGLRTALSLSVTEQLGVRLHLEGWAALNPPTVDIGVSRVWTAPPVGALLGISAVWGR